MLIFVSLHWNRAYIWSYMCPFSERWEHGNCNQYHNQIKVCVLSDLIFGFDMDWRIDFRGKNKNGSKTHTHIFHSVWYLHLILHSYIQLIDKIVHWYFLNIFLSYNVWTINYIMLFEFVRLVYNQITYHFMIQDGYTYRDIQ